LPDSEFTAFEGSTRRAAAQFHEDLLRPWGVELIVDGRFSGVIGDITPGPTAEETLANLAALLRLAAESLEKMSKQEAR